MHDRFRSQAPKERNIPMIKHLLRTRLALGAAVLGSVAGLLLVPSSAYAATAYTTGAPGAHLVTGSEQVEGWGNAACTTINVWGTSFYGQYDSNFGTFNTLVAVFKYVPGYNDPSMPGYEYVGSDFAQVNGNPGWFYLPVSISFAPGPGTYYAQAEDVSGATVMSGPITCP
jgi:hypothetical protein